MFPDWLTPELQAELQAHPERMTDCDPWFQFVVQHGQWMTIDGQQQMVMSAEDTQTWLNMLRPTDVAPERVQQLYHLQANFRTMIEQAVRRQNDSEAH
jgi:hypothetical protein